MKHITLNVGITSSGACNLACPSCPVGQTGAKAGKREVMSLEVLNLILSKAKREFIPDAFALFDWNEPLLHPQIHECIAAVNRYGIPCWISSNLSFKDPGCVIAAISAEPDEFRVSCSGFTQDVYKIGHRGGNVDWVKRNLSVLSERKRGTNVYVLWHRYKHNLHESDLMQGFCKQLGIGFRSIEAITIPVERVVNRFNGILEPYPIADSMLTSMEDAAEFCKEHTDDKCSLLNDQLALDWKGDVPLCCGTYRQFAHGVNFLTHSFEEIQRARLAHPFCGSCTEVGAHFYAKQEWSLLTRLYSQAARVIKRYVTV